MPACPPISMMRYHSKEVQSCWDSSKLTITEECIARQSSCLIIKLKNWEEFLFRLIPSRKVLMDSTRRGAPSTRPPWWWFWRAWAWTWTRWTWRTTLPRWTRRRRGSSVSTCSAKVKGGIFFIKIYFEYSVAAKFMIEDDEEQMREELKEAFRIYDKDNQGFITNEILKVNIGRYNIYIPICEMI